MSRLGDQDVKIFEEEQINVPPTGGEEPKTPPGCEMCGKLPQLQKDDLQHYLDLAHKGKVTFAKPAERPKNPCSGLKDPMELKECCQAYPEYCGGQNPCSGLTNPDELKECCNEHPEFCGGQNILPIYFYHPDHLGTSTALTDINGKAYQFFLNLPFGETMAEQKGFQYYNSPYKFNGKELDEETGLYYYGARYFDPRASIWLSVDPLAEEYPAHNPYIYCFNNPVRYLDSDGREPTPFEAALMAADVYGDSMYDLVGGWSRAEDTDSCNFNRNSSDGLRGRMYQRNKANGEIEYAYVYAGTNDMADVGNDLTAVIALSSQYWSAKKLSVNISEFTGSHELTFVGHSLGGGLANLSSLMTGNSAITFNPAWLKKNAYGKRQKLKKGKHRWNYVNTSDPLDMLQTIFGSSVGLENTGQKIDVRSRYNPLIGHLIGQIIERMKANGQATQHTRNGSDDKEVHRSSRNY